MIRTAVFGGSFDPPHHGHEQVVREVLAHRLVDEVWLLPVQSHPFEKKVSSSHHRLAMLELLVQHLADQRVRVEEYELHSEGTNYSYLTLTALAAEYPDRRLQWLMGSDQLAQFHRWHNTPELLRDFPVLVYPRAGSGWELLEMGMQPLTELPMITISSSAARIALSQHDEVTARQLVLPEVAQYSMAHHLYDS